MNCGKRILTARTRNWTCVRTTLLLSAFVILYPLYALSGSEPAAEEAAESSAIGSNTQSESSENNKNDSAVAADRALFGVYIATINDDVQAALEKDGLPRIPLSGGVLVTAVAYGSAAQAAGIRPMDVIAGIGSEQVPNAETFSDLVSRLTPGQPVVATVWRLTENPRTDKVEWSRKSGRVLPITIDKMYERAQVCPLTIVSASIKHNSIGQPIVSMIVKNTFPQDVVAYSVAIHCWDRFERPVIHSILSDDNVYHGISQATVKPGALEGQGRAWTLHCHDNTAKVKVVLAKVRLSDESEWTAGEKEVSVYAYSRK